MTQFPYRRPDGEPATIRSGARSLATACTSLQGAQTEFGHAALTASADWTTPVGQDFVELSGGASVRISAANTQVEGLSSVLTGYAELLEASQDGYDEIKPKWEAEQRTIEAGTHPDATDAERDAVGPARSRQATLERDMEDALDELHRGEDRTATALDSSTETVAPGGSDKSPADLLAQVTRAWAGLAPAIGSFLDTSGKVLGLRDLVTSPDISGKGLSAVRLYAAADDAALLASQVKNLELAKADAVARVIGDTSDMRVLRQWFQSQEAIADAGSDARKAFEAADSASSGFTSSVAATTRFTKGLAVLGIFGSAYDLFANPDDHTGVRRGVDVVVDVASIGAGGVVLAAGAGLIAITPAGAAVIVGIGVVSGAWALGNLVYDHWNDITHGVDVAIDWTGDRLEDGYNGVKTGVEWTGDRFVDAAEGLSDLGESTWNGLTGWAR